MNRAFKIGVEFVIPWLIAAATWTLMGVALSFINWTNAFSDPDAAIVLLLLLIISTAWSAFITYCHIKNGKI